MISRSKKSLWCEGLNKIFVLTYRAEEDCFTLVVFLFSLGCLRLFLTAVNVKRLSNDIKEWDT